MTREPTYLQSLRIEHSNGEVLRFALALGVPRAIRDLQLRGGPTEADYEAARAFGDERAVRADILLYKSKRGETARLCAELIRALAVMAYVPGGLCAGWGIGVRPALGCRHARRQRDRVL